LAIWKEHQRPSARFPREVVAQAVAELQGATELGHSMPRPGRYFDEDSWEDRTPACRQDFRRGERSGGRWRGVKSVKHIITGFFPWFDKRTMSISQIERALASRRSATFERLVVTVAEHIQKELSKQDSFRPEDISWTEGI